jgi:hypothetical protein
VQVAPRPRGALEALVRTVADGDHQVGLANDVVERPWSCVGEVEARSLGRPNGLGVDARGRFGTRALGRDLVAIVPQGGGELRSRRVRVADEEEPSGGDDLDR